MKKYFLRLLCLAATILLVVLSAKAQYNMSEAQLPFQSTSTMQMSGSRYSSTPMINVYGQAEHNGTTYAQNKVGQRRNNPGTPDPTERLPIGDAPIAFILGLGVLYILLMRKKERVED